MATPSKYTTGFADGMFSSGWMQGGVQGAWIQEPHTRYSLEGGFSNEPTALFGGVAIKTTMGAKGRMELGAGVTKAAAVADVQGFVIDSKMYHAVVTAQNTAPQVRCMTACISPVSARAFVCTSASIRRSQKRSMALRTRRFRSTSRSSKSSHRPAQRTLSL